VALLLLVFVMVRLVTTEPAAAEREPVLRLIPNQPAAVRGQGFQPGERVRLFALASLKRVSVTSVADEQGTFKAAFRDLGAEGCSQLVIAAVGSEGSRALVKLGRRPCPPPRVPPQRH
jgi:hypothetical protein